MIRTSFILFALCFISIIGFGQTLQLEKASPFTAVKWEDDLPIVQYDNAWYGVDKINVYSIKEILDFCQHQYGSKWQRRFSEDLVEVLTAMGSQPNETVHLLLSQGDTQQNVIGIYTRENRDQVWAYNNTGKKKISVPQAIEDLSEFQQILEDQSSYIQLADYDYQSAINGLKAHVANSSSDVDVNFLTYEMAKIMAELGDRHSSVKNESFAKHEYPTYSLQLPFPIAPLNGKAVALKRIEKKGVYAYYDADFPFIKSINNNPINELIDSLAYKSKKAPKGAKLSRGTFQIQQLGRLYFTNNLQVPEQIEIVFTDGVKDKTAIVALQDERFRYYSQLERSTYLKSTNIHNGNFEGISTMLEENIGYISLPMMFHFDEIDGLEQYLDSSFNAFENTKALIIDLRFNPGGGREIIQKCAGYMIPPSHSPWVANIAYLRTNEKDGTHESMSNRYLYPYASDAHNATHKKSIDAFAADFKTHREFDHSKFSKPHYMVLESGKAPYSKPIYILVNEHSFSAATVFTSAFKGLPNTQIVGITTDGSSGNSKRINLKHSKIRVKVSTMLSFQRNGKTLDGIGTEPDIHIPANETQILNGEDVQLEKLLKIIEAH